MADDPKALSAMTKAELLEAAGAAIAEADNLRAMVETLQDGRKDGARWEDAFAAACVPSGPVDMSRAPSKRQAEQALKTLVSDATRQLGIMGRNLPTVPAHAALKDAIGIYHDQINAVLYPRKPVMAEGAE